MDCVDIFDLILHWLAYSMQNLKEDKVDDRVYFITKVKDVDFTLLPQSLNGSSNLGLTLLNSFELLPKYP